MAILLYINGVDRSSLVLWETLAWNQNMTDQVDTVNFSIQKFGSRTVEPEVMDEITLYDGGEKVFGGNIVRVDKSVSAVDRLIFKCTVKDYTHLMDRRLVVEKYTSKPVINIISDIVNRYINKGDRIEIGLFEPDEIWTGGTVDTTNFMVGDQGRKLTSSGVMDSMSRLVFFDLQPTGFATTDLMEMDCYVDTVTNLTTVTVKLGDTGMTNYYSKNITANISSDGWNLVSVALSSFSSTGSPSWSNIRKIQLEVTGSAAVNVTFDNWQVRKLLSFSRSGAYNARQTVNYMNFKYEYPSKCFQKMAQLFAWNWYVDEDKIINFFDKFERNAPFGLTDTGGNYVYKSLRINNNADQLRNSIYVRGGDYLGTAITEDLDHQADGVNKIFKLGFKYANYSLTVGAVEKAVGIDNLDGYNDNEGVKQINYGTSQLNVGDANANSYQGQQVIATTKARRTKVKVRVKKVGAPADNFTVRIYADNGSNAPDIADPLSAASVLAGGSITTSFAEYTFALTETATNDLLLDVDAKYHVVCYRSGAADASNYYQVDVYTGGAYSGIANTGDNVPAWTANAYNLYFAEVLGYEVLYSFNEKTLTFDAAPAAASDIEFTGDPYYPVFVLYKDSVSINSYGEYQVRIIDKSILSKTGARQRALEEILAWADTANEATFVTYESGIYSGQTINIQSTIRGLDEDFIVKSVQAIARGPESFEYRVNCMTKRTYGILYWLQLQIMKDNTEIDIDDNELEDKIEGVVETVTIVDAVTPTLYTGKRWGIVAAEGSDLVNTGAVVYAKPTLNDIGTHTAMWNMNDGEGAPISTGTAGLVSMWKMDEGSGSNVDDAVGTNDGTITGATWNGYGQFGYTGDNSLAFSTGAQYVSLGDFTACEGLSTMTLMGWAKKDSIAAAGTLFRKISTSTSSIGAYIANVAGMKFVVEVRNGAASYATFNFADVIFNNVWFHWALVFDGGGATNADKLKLYINGVERTLTYTSTIGATTPANTATAYIGYDASVGGWGGAQDNVAFFSTAESGANILTYYNAETSSLIADGSANANHMYVGGTSSGAPLTWTTDHAGTADAALDFGTGKAVLPGTGVRPTSSFTLAMMVKFDDLETGVAGQYPLIFSNFYYGGSGDQNGFALYLNYAGDNNMRVYMANGTSTALTYTVSHATLGINTTDWFHVAIRFDDAANTVDIFINGVKKGTTGTFSTTIGGYNTERFTVGYIDTPPYAENLPEYRWDGKMAFMSIYNSAISDANLLAQAQTTLGLIATPSGYVSIADFTETGSSGTKLSAHLPIKYSAPSSGTPTIFGHWKDAAGKKSWKITTDTSGQISVYLSADGTNIAKQFKVPIGNSTSDNAWHFVGFTYDGAQNDPTNGTAGLLNIYIDGALIAHASLTKTVNSACASLNDTDCALTLFADLSSGGALANGFIGSLDEVLITSDVLTAAEILTLYASGTGRYDVAIEALIDNIQLLLHADDKSGTTILDSSGYGRNGTITGTYITWGADKVTYMENALVWDGGATHIWI